MRTDEFDRILDDCLNRLSAGATIAECVAAHPEHAGRLEALLRTAGQSRDACDWQPSLETTQRAQARLRVAIANRVASREVRRRPALLRRLTAHPLALAGIASLAVIALTVLLVAIPLFPDLPLVTPLLPPESGDPATGPPDATTEPTISPPMEPTEPPADEPAATTPAPDAETVMAQPSADGNFVFYLSDAPNDIADFSRLLITIESIALKPRDGGPWITIVPTETQSDLVQVQGDLAHELWRGQVPEGEYAMVFVNVSHIEGILASQGVTADVSLPSEALHVTSVFSVDDTTTTEFVFDITVHRIGGAGAQSRYIVAPQAGESGTGRRIQPVVPQFSTEERQNNGMGHQDGATPEGEGGPKDGRPQPAPVPGPGMNGVRDDEKDPIPA